MAESVLKVYGQAQSNSVQPKQPQGIGNLLSRPVLAAQAVAGNADGLRQLVRLATFVSMFASSVLSSSFTALAACATSWQMVEGTIDGTRFLCHDFSHLLRFGYKGDFEKGGLINASKNMVLTVVDFLSGVAFADSLKLINVSSVASKLANTSVFGLRAFAFVTRLSLFPTLITLVIGYYVLAVANAYLKATSSDDTDGVSKGKYKSDNDFTKNMYDVSNATAELVLKFLSLSGYRAPFVALCGIVATTLGALSVARADFYGPTQAASQQ